MPTTIVRLSDADPVRLFANHCSNEHRAAKGIAVERIVFAEALPKRWHLAGCFTRFRSLDGQRRCSYSAH